MNLFSFLLPHTRVPGAPHNSEALVRLVPRCGTSQDADCCASLAEDMLTEIVAKFFGPQKPRTAIASFLLIGGDRHSARLVAFGLTAAP